MAEVLKLATQPRTDTGTRFSRRLRAKGQIPAVVYGQKEDNVSVALSEEDVVHAIKHGARVLDLDNGGKVQKVLIREIQWDHLGKHLLHLDFARITADQRVVVQVRLDLRGQAAGVTAGGVLDQPVHNLEIECPAISVPESIRHNISEMQVGDIVHVKDLTLPEGVIAMGDPEQVIVQIRMAAAEEEEEAAEKAEPEVIGKDRDEETGE